MKKVCVVTGSRSEYGLLKWLMKDLQESDKIDLKIIVTGSHLSEKFGYSYREIIEDGFNIDAEVNVLDDLKSQDDVAHIIASCVYKLSNSLKLIEPDLLILLGDRYEIFSAAICAYVAGIPIVHIHGGELTEGAFDDGFRHSITKMSCAHFVAAEEYRNRVIQLGENPDNVFVVGGLGVDAISRAPLFDRSSLEKALNFKFTSQNLLITFHPQTLGNVSPVDQVSELLKALHQFPDIQMIFTMPNADPGNNQIFEAINLFVKDHRNSVSFKTLGQKRYLSLLSHVNGVVGNSSSGIIEAPALKIPTLNIGARQDGRLKASSIIDCAADSHSIFLGLQELLSDGFRLQLPLVKNPYGVAGAAKKIAAHLIDLNINLSKQKKFFDISWVAKK